MIDNDQVTPEQVDTTSEESTTETEIQHQQSPQEDRAANMRRLREKAERAERERDELARRIQEIEAKGKDPYYEEDDIQIDPDALAEGKHLKKVMQKIKKLEEENRQYRQKTAADVTEARLKMQYSDFDKVVSRENVEALREEYPEIAESIHANPDLYKRAVSAYTAIKKMGIYQDQDKFSAEKAAVQKNAAKPRPMASLSPQQGDSPLSKANAFANGLTNELKSQLWKEMQDIAKSR